MTEDQDAKESHAEVGSKNFISSKAREKKSRLQRPLTKIVLRRLPPTMSEETFLEQVSPIPEHDHFYFARPDPSLGNSSYSRAYINFINIDDIYLFRDKFDGYVFLDDKGVEYVGIVEYAPFQRIQKKKKKKDPKCGTIESDPVYQEFLESLKEQDTDNNQPKLEYSYPVNEGNDKKVVSTPLLDYLAARKQDKRSRDERRRRDNDKRKMRILKPKDGTIKKSSEVSEDERYEEGSDCCDYSSVHNCWFGEQRIYHKSKMKYELKNSSSQESDDLLTKDTNWDSHFPALSTKTHSTFTITSGNICEKSDMFETNEKSAGDTYFKSYLEEELDEDDVKKSKSNDWEKDKAIVKEEQTTKSSENKEGAVFESKTFREHRKTANASTIEKKKKHDDRKETSSREEELPDDDKSTRRVYIDKFKDSPREIKSKKYSETRKERLKLNENMKGDKSSLSTKITSSLHVGDKMSEVKIIKSINQDDIKPFTQLPQVKTEDLTKVIEEMDRKMKLEEQNVNDAKLKDAAEEQKKHVDMEARVVTTRVRRNSLDMGETYFKEHSQLTQQKSIDESSKSSREDSVEKEKGDSNDRRSEKRIRNRDRPSMVIYQPGMGKFSKQRLAKEKEVNQNSSTKTVNESEKKDT